MPIYTREGFETSNLFTSLWRDNFLLGPTDIYIFHVHVNRLVIFWRNTAEWLGWRPTCHQTQWQDNEWPPAASSVRWSWRRSRRGPAPLSAGQSQGRWRSPCQKVAICHSTSGWRREGVKIRYSENIKPQYSVIRPLKTLNTEDIRERCLSTLLVLQKLHVINTVCSFKSTNLQYPTWGQFLLQQARAYKK